MGKRKNIIIAAVMTVLMTGFCTAQANSSNSLLQMDVKRASAADSVDVTFYTTGGTQNTVVTRKSANRYVVLLPNVSGSSSAAPGLGGVKDLISDVQVKNVDDGIGGYTKVTFSTTKPVNIKTYMKKTAPLTQAQKDYKTLIAQNNKPAAQSQTAAKPAVQKTVQPAAPAKTAVKQPAAHNTTTAQAKPQSKPVSKTNEVKAVNKSNNANTQNTKQVSLPKISFTPVTPPKTKTAPAKQVKQPETVQPKVKTEPAKTQKSLAVEENNFVPKMKFDKNGRREMNLEPRVTHKIIEDKPAGVVKHDPIFNVNEETKNQAVQDKKADTVKEAAKSTGESKNKSGFHIPLWLITGGATAFGLLVLFLVFDAAAHASKKDSDRLKSFFNISAKNQEKRRRKEYNDIINDENLNWQEKYKKYTEKDKKLHLEKESKDMSYVTDMSASKKAIVTPDMNFTSDRRTLRNGTAKNIMDSKSDIMPVFSKSSEIIKPADTNPDKTEKLKEDLRAKISQMEHSLAQTPQIEPPEEVSNEVKSEDDSIIGTFKDIKLKSFAKTVTLKETSRSLLKEDKKHLKDKSYKEGRFVKLKNSPLNISKRNSASSILDNKYLINNGEMKMETQNENYLVSSLDEYLSILDTEEEKSTSQTVADTLAQVRPSVSSRSGITNPISRASNPMMPKQESSHYMNGLIVKSGYNIDSEKGFYLVNIDGVSALVGRIRDDIFILKKFNYIIDKPLQVRLDHQNVYIVKAGGFKCLVDVSKNKMGTLIEI